MMMKHPCTFPSKRHCIKERKKKKTMTRLTKKVMHSSSKKKKKPCCYCSSLALAAVRGGGRLCWWLVHPNPPCSYSGMEEPTSKRSRDGDSDAPPAKLARSLLSIPDMWKGFAPALLGEDRASYSAAIQWLTGVAQSLLYLFLFRIILISYYRWN